jgi:adenylyl-sulfate kinase
MRSKKMTEQKAKNKGCVVWLTGYPCSGKTTIGDTLDTCLRSRGCKVERLDGDVVRESLCADLGFSEEDRHSNLMRIAFVAKLLAKHGVIVICTFVSPYKEVRDLIRFKVMTDFIEVFVDCDIKTCINRDVKGMYRKALDGEIKGFTGIDSPYEPPLVPEVTVNTDDSEVIECVMSIFEYLKNNDFV